MNTQVDWNGQKTIIPHPSVPAFRLLCEQYGLYAKWDTKEKKLLLEKEDLKGKKVCLISKSTGADYLEMKILRSVEHFLSETGMEVLVYSNPAVTPKTGDVIVQCTTQQSKRTQTLESVLHTTAKPYPKVLVESLQKDFKNMEIVNKVHRVATKKSSSPVVHLDLKIPEMNEETQNELVELLSISLASGILRYFQEKHPMTLLGSLSPEIRQTFLNIIPNLQHDSMDKAENPSTEVHEPEVIASREITPFKVIEKEPIPIPSTMLPPELRAEVFFDYTLVVPSDDEDDEWLVLGSMYIKNTGNQPLYNPTIILNITPANAVSIGGQTLPPNAVDTLGVQDGTTWKYLDENYLRNGRETGEYRIGPTGPLVIPPGQTETHGMQLTIIKSKVEGAIIAKGAVHFEQQGLQFFGNNQITISM